MLDNVIYQNFSFIKTLLIAYCLHTTRISCRIASYPERFLHQPINHSIVHTLSNIMSSRKDEF